MSELVLNAATYASQAHRRINQLRRYSGQPYEVHLKAVAGLVESVIDDPEMIAAAWLHDVVEDPAATVEDVERTFGPAVAALVMELTDVSRPGHGNRGARVKIYREHLASSSVRAKTIKLADLIDNCRDIVRHDPRFAPVYLAEMAALLDVLGEGDPRLYRKARKVLGESSARLGLGQSDESSATPEDALQDHERALVKKHARTIGIFARTFCAEDLAEPFQLFDQNTPAGVMDQTMTAENVRVAGIRNGGDVSTYLLFRDFAEGDRRDLRRRVGGDQVVGPEASLADVIEILTRHDYCFVGFPGNVTGVIERADIQKPVARMWLFGIITLLEMYFTESIKTLWSDGTWVKLLTPRRLAAANQVRTERLRRDQPCQLIDCLQLADKGELLLQNPLQLAAFGFETRGAAKRVMRDIQSLRNNLAHAQDIVVHDWPQIVRLARRVEGLYRMTS
jgi:hypothetical protein